MTEQQLIYVRRRRQENISWQAIAKEVNLPWQQARREFMAWVQKKNDGETI